MSNGIELTSHWVNVTLCLKLDKGERHANSYQNS